jgi:hypothetical protein
MHVQAGGDERVKMRGRPDAKIEQGRGRDRRLQFSALVKVEMERAEAQAAFLSNLGGMSVRGKCYSSARASSTRATC